MCTNLTDLIEKLADRAESEGLAIDGEPGGAVSRFVEANCIYKPGDDFFIVFLLTAELADRAARREGFVNQAHRAAEKMREKIAKRHPNEWERVRI